MISLRVRSKREWSYFLNTRCKAFETIWTNLIFIVSFGCKRWKWSRPTYYHTFFHQGCHVQYHGLCFIHSMDTEQKCTSKPTWTIQRDEFQSRYETIHQSRWDYTITDTSFTGYPVNQPFQTMEGLLECSDHGTDETVESQTKKKEWTKNVALKQSTNWNSYESLTDWIRTCTFIEYGRMIDWVW